MTQCQIEILPKAILTFFTSVKEAAITAASLTYH